MTPEQKELLAAAREIFDSLTDGNDIYLFTDQYSEKELVILRRLQAALTAVESSQNQPWDGRERRKEDALGFDADSDWRKP